MAKETLKQKLNAKRKPTCTDLTYRKYDPNIIIKEMLSWVEHEDSINFGQFCWLHGYIPETIWRLENEFQDFRDAYVMCKMKIGERRERMLNAEMLNPGAFHRSQGHFDPFLYKHESEEKDKDAQRKKGVDESQVMNFCKLAKKINSKDG